MPPSEPRLSAHPSVVNAAWRSHLEPFVEDFFEKLAGERFRQFLLNESLDTEDMDDG